MRDRAWNAVSPPFLLPTWSDIRALWAQTKPPRSSVDVVFGKDSWLLFEHKPAFFAELHRVLAPSGATAAYAAERKAAAAILVNFLR